MCSDDRPDSFDEGVRVLGRRKTKHGQADLFRCADVVLAHLDHTERSIELCRRFNKPLVHILHNDYAHQVFGTDRKADLYVFCAHWVEQATRDRNLRVPWIVCHPPVGLVKHRLFRPLFMRTFVLQSNLNRNKGGYILRDVAEELPDVRFKGVIGAYSEQPDKSEFPKNVALYPPTPEFEKLLAGARVVICPSAYESYGMVAVQACAAGVPVVATATPGLVEALGPAGWFVPPEQRENLPYWIEPIQALMSDDRLWAHWSERARERGKALAVEEEHNFRHLVSQIECLAR